jgi:hypothetical protein
MKSDEILIKTFDQVKNDNFDQVKFDQVIVCPNSFLKLTREVKKSVFVTLRECTKSKKMFPTLHSGTRREDLHRRLVTKKI